MVSYHTLHNQIKQQMSELKKNYDVKQNNQVSVDNCGSDTDVIALFHRFTDYVMSTMPPGPKYIPLNYVINTTKGGTIIYISMLMYVYNCYNKTAYTYLALHGTYGLLWLLKEQIFPDKSWQRHITFMSALMCFINVLGPYWISPYLIISGNIDANNLRIFFCIMMHTFGCVLMMASDTQKYFELKSNKLLINDGWFKYSRNTNYLGEMIIYLTYALLGNSIIPYLVLLYVWCGLFYINMKMKDRSIKRKEGGLQYMRTSNMLVPYAAIVNKMKTKVHSY